MEIRLVAVLFLYLILSTKYFILERMKVLIFYRPNSEHSRVVEEYVVEFSKQYPDQPLTLLDVDSKEGSRQAEVYDVVSYPTVLALSDDGSTLQRWDNGQMPLKGEVAYYAR